MRSSMRIISMLLSIALMCCSINVTAIAAGNENDETIYVDGIAYTYKTNDDGSVEVRCKKNGGKAYITVQQDGKAEAQAMDENGKYSKYKLDIKDLSSNKVDVVATHTISESDGTKKTIVEKFNSIEDIIGDCYTGQVAATLAIGGASIAAGVAMTELVSAIIAGTKAVVIGGSVCFIKKARTPVTSVM